MLVGSIAIGSSIIWVKSVKGFCEKAMQWHRNSIIPYSIHFAPIIILFGWTQLGLSRYPLVKSLVRDGM